MPTELNHQKSGFSSENLKQIHKVSIQRALVRLSKNEQRSPTLEPPILTRQIKEDIQHLLELDEQFKWLEQSLTTIRELIFKASQEAQSDACKQMQTTLNELIQEIYSRFDDLEYYLNIKLQNINLLQFPFAEALSSTPVNEDYSHIAGVEGDTITINSTPIQVIFTEDDLNSEERAKRIVLAINESEDLKNDVKAVSDGLGSIYISSPNTFSLVTEGNGVQINIKSGEFRPTDKYIKQVEKAIDFVHAKQERLIDFYINFSKILEDLIPKTE